MNKTLEKKLSSEIKQFEKETKDHLSFIFHNVVAELSDISQNQSDCRVECFLTSTFFNNLNGLDFRISLHNKTKLNSKTLEAFANASRTLNSFEEIQFISFNLEITTLFSSLDDEYSTSIKKEAICIASAENILDLVPIVKRLAIKNVLNSFECLKNVSLGRYALLLSAHTENPQLDEKTFLDSLEAEHSSI